VTVASFARIERGQSNPTWVTVRAIAAALDLALTELGVRIDNYGL
jgi:transcriptional regulator with XRE-family HTH domain